MSDDGHNRGRATLDRLDQFLDVASDYTEACRTLGNRLQRWHDERPTRKRPESLLTGPTVSFDELIEHKQVAKQEFDRLRESIDAVKPTLDGLGDAIGNYHEKPHALVTNIRHALSEVERSWGGVWPLLLIADASFVTIADKRVSIRALHSSYKQFSKAVFDETHGIVAHRNWLTAIVGVESGSVSRKFTSETLAQALGIDTETNKQIVSGQTIRNAMEKANLQPNKPGDKTATIDRRKASIIATARRDMGFKRGEEGAWNRLLAQIGAPKIGAKPQAKSKSNPKLES